MSQELELTPEQREKRTKILNVLNNGMVKKYMTETDDVQKSDLASKINDSVDFDLTNHDDFSSLYSNFDRLKGHRESIEKGEKNRKYLESKGSKVTDWGSQIIKSEEILKRLEYNLDVELNNIVATLGKSR